MADWISFMISCFPSPYTYGHHTPHQLLPKYLFSQCPACCHFLYSGPLQQPDSLVAGCFSYVSLLCDLPHHTEMWIMSVRVKGIYCLACLLKILWNLILFFESSKTKSTSDSGIVWWKELIFRGRTGFKSWFHQVTPWLHFSLTPGKSIFWRIIISIH